MYKYTYVCNTSNLIHKERKHRSKASLDVSLRRFCSLSPSNYQLKLSCLNDLVTKCAKVSFLFGL